MTTATVLILITTLIAAAFLAGATGGSLWAMYRDRNHTQ